MLNIDGKFLLEVGKWYACKFMGDVLSVSYRLSLSPIRIDRITPLKTGKSILYINFFHLNYPEGVQDKEYQLKIMLHKRRFILARSLSHSSDDPRILYIHEITKEWVQAIWGKNYDIPHQDLKRQIEQKYY